MKPFDFQVPDIEYLVANRGGLLNVEPGGGKALRNDEPVLTTDRGWVAISDLRPGDNVIGGNGLPTEVTGVYPQGVRELVEVTMTDGTKVVCDWDHLWTYQTANDRTRGTSRTETTREIYNKGLVRGGKRAVSLPLPGQVETADVELPLDPYVLGVLLGDGSISDGVSVTTDEWIVDQVESLGYTVTRQGHPSLGITTAGVPNITPALRSLELHGKRSWEKNIPSAYLLASRNQRVELLRGLMDTDGWVSVTPTRGNREERHRPGYGTSSPQLADDFLSLVFSLGGSGTITSKRSFYTYKGERLEGRTAYTVNFRLPHNTIPFRLPTKKDRYRPFGKYAPARYIESIVPVGSGEATCIKVLNEDGLFVTRNYVVTHNTFTSAYAVHQMGTGVNLVIAPLNTHANAWHETVLAVTGQTIRKVGSGNKREKAALFDMEMGTPGWYIATPQWVTTTDISAWWLDALIVDEIHLMGKPGSKGQRKLSGYNGQDEENLSLAYRAEVKIALSGTPARNKFERMWSVVRFLWPDLSAHHEIADGNYYRWLSTNMTYEKVITGRDAYGNYKTAKKWLNEKTPGSLIANMPSVVQHFRRHECCEFHPDGFLLHDAPNITKRVVPLLAAQRKAIKEIEEQYLTWLDDQPLVVELPLHVQQRIRQITLGIPMLNDEGGVTFATDTKSPMIDQLLEDLEALDGEPVVVYMESQSFARVLTERLVKAGYSAFEYSGKTVKTRGENLRKFGTEFQVCVGVLSAIGTGTDGIQRICNNEVWFERSTDGVVNTQAEARTDRLGAKDQVQRFVYSDDLGYADGRFSTEMENKLRLAASLRKKLK